MTVSIKRLILMAAIAIAGHSAALAGGISRDSSAVSASEHAAGLLAPLEPAYLRDPLIGSPWSGNWFVSVSAGISAFVGTPMGCEDVFGRTQPAIQVSAGKWLTPAIGMRVAYQGFGMKLTDASITDHRYYNVHADLMWNVIGMNRKDELGLHRWTVAPYVGSGVIHHEDNDKTLFAISYGVMAAYRLSRRLSVNMELSGLNTFQDFDGQGKENKFGDQMYTLSAGLTVNVGQVGWRRAVDANPYRQQNELMREYINELLRERSGGYFEPAHAHADISFAATGFAAKREMGKDSDYSGLASLKARLAHKDWNGKGAAPRDTVAGQAGGGSRLVGVPFYFFFKINTAELTDPSQVQNLVNLARVANAYNLNVYVDGAADSATGTEPVNETLSEERAAYIARLLREQGVPENAIRTTAKGGIDRFSPIERNRHTRVMVSTPRE